MRVDIRGCGNVAMPQPFLDVFQADTVRIKQTRAAMTKIVIPNTAQTGFFQYERKILCDKVRLDALTDFIHIDVIQKLRAIRVAAYHKRWGIETKYNDVKNKLEIENFTGYSPDAILQDFYATMFLADLAGVLEYDLREEIEAAHIRPENRYTYKLNVAMTISELKRTVVEMLSTSSRLKRERLYAHMVVRLSKAVVPVRPDRSSDRLKKHKSLKFPSNVKRC